MADLMQRIGRLFPLIVALALPASGLAGNIQTAALNGAVDSLNSCPTRSLLLNFEVYRGDQAVRQVPIWRLQDNAAFFFTSGLMIDADGAPNAYNPRRHRIGRPFQRRTAGTLGRHYCGRRRKSRGSRVRRPFPGILHFLHGTFGLDERTHRPHAVRGCVKDPVYCVARRVGPRLRSATGRFGGCSEHAKRQVFVRDFRGHREARRRIHRAGRQSGNLVGCAPRREVGWHSIPSVSRLGRTSADVH